MSEMVLDTHVLVWWLEANHRLPASVRALLDNKELDLHLAAIVVAELVDLCVKGRTGLKLDPVLAVLRDDERFVMHDFTAEMAMGIAKYAALPDIHDRCIVAATAKLIESRGDVVLVTRDKAIRDSRLVPTMWE
ncbi:MAG: PIN domain-containing protein [Tepidisphaeraceae bacterium]|jgi:PIN domain nuclease of toxin-antitoxin system